MDAFTLLTLCAIGGLILTGLIVTVAELLDYVTNNLTDRQRRAVNDRAEHRARRLRRLGREA